MATVAGSCCPVCVPTTTFPTEVTTEGAPITTATAPAECAESKCRVEKVETSKMFDRL